MSNSPSGSSVNFQYGSILYGKMLLPDGSHHTKFFIILNKQPKDQVIHFVFTTSQTRFYNRRSQFRSQFVKIPKGEIGVFRSETLINCTNIESSQRDILERKLQRKELKRLGILPEKYLDRIRGIIERSILIEDETKERII